MPEIGVLAKPSRSTPIQWLLHKPAAATNAVSSKPGSSRQIPRSEEGNPFKAGREVVAKALLEKEVLDGHEIDVLIGRNGTDDVAEPEPEPEIDG